MPELPHDWLFESLKRLDERMTAHAAEARLSAAETRADFQALRQVLDAHAADDRVVADRVTRMEADVEAQRRLGQKHGAIAGTIAAGAVAGLLEGLKRLFGPHP